MTHLEELENRSIYIIREAYYRFDRLALLWSIGKDSTVLLWLIRKAFFGQVPIPVMHIDTTFKFPEMYAFREKWAQEWNLNLIVETNFDAINAGVNYDNNDAFTCCHELKTVPLKNAIPKYQLDGIFVGIRRDEHGIRSKERYFSPRDEDFKWDYANQPTELWNQFKYKLNTKEVGEKKLKNHFRVHPLLHFTELDIWRYIEKEDIPVNELYFSNKGERYRSLGCMPITKPVKSKANSIRKIIKELEVSTEAERAGRAQDKEDNYTMQNLRSLGYM